MKVTDKLFCLWITNFDVHAIKITIFIFITFYIRRTILKGLILDIAYSKRVNDQNSGLPVQHFFCALYYN